MCCLQGPGLLLLVRKSDFSARALVLGSVLVKSLEHLNVWGWFGEGVGGTTATARSPDGREEFRPGLRTHREWFKPLGFDGGQVWPGGGSGGAAGGEWGGM